jgi:ornithine carbamoyltransferase
MRACTTLAGLSARWSTESLLASATIPKSRCVQPPAGSGVDVSDLLAEARLCLGQTLAKHSTVPVINALSHLYHPCQILADLQTLLEFRQPFTTDLSSLEGLTIAWVGDSNNILNEMMVTYPRMGVNLQIATPKGYDLMPEVVERANEGIKQEGGKGKIIYTNDPAEAVKNANVITTDTWSVFLSLFSLRRERWH